MKRTAKWHKVLTVKELKHLKETESFSLARFKDARIFQKDLEAKFNTYACHECSYIETKLKDTGILA